MICDPIKECFDAQLECDDNNLCTSEYWDPINRVCVYSDVTCVADQVCDPSQGCICDDSDLCTTDFFDSRNQICTCTPVQCPLPFHSCDPMDGQCKEDEELVPCISVIDEDDNYWPSNGPNDWTTIRNDWPDRPFCLLEPYRSSGSHVRIPPAALSDPNFQYHRV
jgi:hypothetical protein